jgi:protein-tyrosine phosphatase
VKQTWRAVGARQGRIESNMAPTDGSHRARDRWVNVDHHANFRDIGGYPTLEGRRVRSGLIYRSDAGARGSLADASVALGLATILDLRTGDECVVDGAHQGREVTTARRLHVPLFEEISANWSEPTDLRADAIADRYLEMLSAGAHRFAVLLRLLASADSLPAVIHCVSGRDRTGIVVACLLSIIGVSDDLVADDYALSPPIRLNPKQAMAFGAETAEVDRRVALRLLVRIRASYGSVAELAFKQGVPHEQLALLRQRLVA